MKKTAVDIIRQISYEVEDRKLPLEVMVRDIQMMHFKIRSVLGDISSLNSVEYSFVESLWKIGKIDEIINEELENLDEDDQEALINYFQEVESETRGKIRDSLSTNNPSEKDKKILKIEIFKDVPLKPTVN